MTSWFDDLFGGGHRPVRRDVHVHVTGDDDGHPTAVPTGGEAFLLSPEGSIDRVRLTQFYHCGCSTLRPAGGQCGERSCRKISCQVCHSACFGCQLPLCPEHAHYVSDREGYRRPFCWRCYDSLQWQSTLNRVWYTLIGRHQ